MTPNFHRYGVPGIPGAFDLPGQSNANSGKVNFLGFLSIAIFVKEI